MDPVLVVHIAIDGWPIIMLIRVNGDGRRSSLAAAVQDVDIRSHIAIRWASFCENDKTNERRKSTISPVAYLELFLGGGGGGTNCLQFYQKNTIINLFMFLVSH